MTEAEKNSPAESGATSDEAQTTACAGFFTKKSCSKIGAVMLTLIFIAAAFDLVFMRLHMMPGATVTPSSTAAVMQLEQRITDVEQKVHALDGRLDELDMRIGKNSPVSISTELPNERSVPSPAPPAAPSAVTEQHMQSDLAALSTAVSALQTEVKQTGSTATQTQQTTQNSLATTIAFMQLRETADAGRGFEADLAALRGLAGNDNGFREPLAQLEPHAAKGAPTVDALREEFMSLEAPASVAIDKATAQNWQARILADLKGLVSIRPLHGGPVSDNFAAAETALVSGDVAAALDALKEFPPEAQVVLKDWKSRAEARKDIDAALRTLANHFIAQASPTTSAPTNARDEP